MIYDTATYFKSHIQKENSYSKYILIMIYAKPYLLHNVAMMTDGLTQVDASFILK